MSPAVCVSYPHALARCGVKSDDELRAVRESDDELRLHYTDVGFVQPAVLKSDEMDYVSYRMGSRIVWSSKPLLIKAGEVVLTDRSGNMIRGRCGNRLSSMPRTPIAPYLPPDMEHEVPVIAGRVPEIPEAPEIAPIAPEAPFALFPLPAFPAAPEETQLSVPLPIVPVLVAPIAPAILPVLFPTGPVVGPRWSHLRVRWLPRFLSRRPSGCAWEACSSWLDGKFDPAGQRGGFVFQENHAAGLGERQAGLDGALVIGQRPSTLRWSASSAPIAADLLRKPAPQPMASRHAPSLRAASSLLLQCGDGGGEGFEAGPCGVLRVEFELFFGVVVGGFEEASRA